MDSIFGDIARIEKQADEIIAKAKRKAAQIRRDSAESIACLNAETDESIKQTRAQLAEEYEAGTQQALNQINVAFLKDEDDLECVRGERFDKLVAWTAEQIARRQAAPDNTSNTG